MHVHIFSWTFAVPLTTGKNQLAICHSDGRLGCMIESAQLIMIAIMTAEKPTIVYKSRPLFAALKRPLPVCALDNAGFQFRRFCIIATPARLT